MPVIYTWQPAGSLTEVLQQLRQGACVALPTESTYELVASARFPEAVARLQTLAGNHGEVPAVVVSDEAQLRDWMPGLRGMGTRLFRKMGPGPLVLRANAGYSAGLWHRLPEQAQRFLERDDLLAVRWPAHPLWADLRQIDEPLISLPIASASTVDAIAFEVREALACIVDAGPTEFASLPSRVRLSGRRCELEREGALGSEDIQDLSLCRILFVCTGNTCRSPMAEVLCGKLLADQLGCAVGELKQHGFCVQSAGLAAMIGGEASPEAVVVAQQEGADLSHHRSQMVSMEMLAWADHLFAMTAGHWYALKNVPLAGIPEPRLLSPLGEDVADPIGGELTDYRSCADQMLACLRQRLPELLES